jgi:hypothetical protein
MKPVSMMGSSKKKTGFQMYKIDENSEEYIPTHPDVVQKKAPIGELESRALR